jgi:hypothetical protein
MKIERNYIERPPHSRIFKKIKLHLIEFYKLIPPYLTLIMLMAKY